MLFRIALKSFTIANEIKIYAFFIFSIMKKYSEKRRKKRGISARTQLIRIDVIDVDEPPTFENGPKPYMAVVPYEQPIGMYIYKV